MTTLFRGLDRYHKGKTEDGKELFAIPLPPDEEGMIGRQCPREECEPRYFKIKTGASEGSDAQNQHETPTTQDSDRLFCPYCETVGEVQDFHTEAQIEWVKSMLVRDVVDALQDMLAGAFKSSSHPITTDLFGISLHLRRGQLPPIRQYTEENLKRTIDCPHCGGTYSVYGLSFVCPFCGGGSLVSQLKHNIDMVGELLALEHVVQEKVGPSAALHHLGNCLEDLVSTFEGFAKAIYRGCVRRKFPRPEAEERLSRIKTQFQRLPAAAGLIKSDLNADLFSGVSPEDQAFLEVLFLKRHVITHNLGLVDEKYRKQAQDWTRVGAEVHLSSEEIERGLSLVHKLLASLSAQVGANPQMVTP